ncbi:heme biosynthesis protein HemY [Parasulfitobacter algicola]|uniref:Heme biosynthesis protein HemY n=1 Tax=Parasulfitobacter algicola TaxID=2614809 RepID=A0ABX2IVL6_9RHOB|nr:heme biosynthesis HemY N-terminal domain-containing protein [Sulfitobacter algicola]NSX55075.1 heme biosynthesis protein HemY [Sulfitobacter algicola]
MLWSMIKILLFVAIVAVLAYGAGLLLDMEGGVQITFGGMEFTLGPLLSIIVVVTLVFAVWLFLKLFGLLIAVLRFINGDETAISRHFDRNRERKGFQALSDGLMALASGEGRLAMSKAEKAEKYLRKPELTNLITAQAAEMTGDTKQAEQVYKRLLQDDRTRFVGVRGIMKQKLSEGDTETALALAEKAFALKPKHVETQDVLLRLQAGKEDWSGARKTLNAKLKYGTLPRDIHKRRDAVLALSEAKEIANLEGTIESQEAAIEANRLSPDLIPAAILAAQTYIEQDKKRYAARVLKKAWEAQPHPDLAATFAEIEPDEAAADRIKRFQALTKIMPDHPETKMLLAELNITAEDFPEARRAIGDLSTSAPTARSLTIMAAIERGEGGEDAVVRGWLAKALTASRGPQWVCDNCHNIHGTWVPVCENCASFDTLSWKVPPAADIAMPSSTEMLPLLVEKPKPDTPELIEAEELSPDDAVLIEDAALERQDK